MTSRGRRFDERGAGRCRRTAWSAPAALLVALLTGTAALACGGGDARTDEGDGAERGAPGEVVRAGNAETAVVATAEDWEILAEKVRWARGAGVDTLPVGEAAVRLGRTFVGTPYVPRTLEVEGPERLVVNLRALDCVTFVESVLATVHLVQGAAGEVDVEDRDALRDAYAGLLARIRYRDGVLDGYPSRLHYFSEWIRDGEEKGIVRDVTGELGGVDDPEPVNFMTSHPDAYRQLADPENRAALERIEQRISRTSRTYLPQDRIAGAAAEIRNGDVIAATSTEEGLDVAHTGFAVRHEGDLHLLHAPLVGDSVELSERTLAERIADHEGQDGILVARPRPPEPLRSAGDRAATRP